MLLILGICIDTTSTGRIASTFTAQINGKVQLILCLLHIRHLFTTLCAIANANRDAQATIDTAEM